MKSSAEIRKAFLDFFNKKGHSVVPSASLVPKDYTLLLTIAGMVPFKPFFLGLEQPPFKKATSAQKCIRTNDIENVGKTPRHHTFFEMLGNFSFGDYFKEEAIEYAWEFLTAILKIDKNKLFVTIFEDDEEAFHYWSKHVPPDKITRLGEKHNFWEAGPTGPCGPCSEIYYDTGADDNCPNQDNCKPGCDCNRYLEIWNLVFMQYNKDIQGKLSPLPQKNIDTGMGLERICSVLQNVDSNFKTDLFLPLTNSIRKIASQPNQSSEYVIADHMRAVVFLLADGVLPGNEGRGYILKKILRRTIRHGKILGINKPFLSELAKILINNYSEFYSELSKQKDIILTIIEAEENNFRKTLDNGLLLLDEIIKNDKTISGENAFKLFDTYGFPPELTQEIAENNGISVDFEGFEKLMLEQKNRSRNASVFYKDGESKPIGGEAIIASNHIEKINMARNHSATHLLQNALRKVLGNHVQQAGSMVAPEKLRFDFTHPKPLSEEEIKQVENQVNQMIMHNSEVAITETDYKTAVENGAIALFTEKYGEKVRVVKMGESVELCGGTHVNRVGDIGFFKITSESAISTGVRRIEAITGTYALNSIQSLYELLKNVSSNHKVKPEAINSLLTNQKEQIKTLSNKISDLTKIQKNKIINDFIQKYKETNEPLFLYLDNPQINLLSNTNDLKDIALSISTQLKNIVFLSANIQNTLTTALSSNLNIAANELANLIKNKYPNIAKGGGNKESAQIIWSLNSIADIKEKLNNLSW